MKKVLLVAYHFPPDEEVGSLRPLGLAKNFYRYGWDPIILTVRIEGRLCDAYRSQFRIVETNPFDIFIYCRKWLPFKLKPGLGIGNDTGGRKLDCFVKWFRYLFKAVFAFPDRNVGWYPAAIRAAKQILADEKIDLILSTSSPWTSTLVARKLSVKYKIPWIADFRDLWSQNHHYEFGWIRNFSDRTLEKWTLKQARRLVIVSTERAKKWRRLHGDQDIRAITLGFDEEVFSTPATRPVPPDQFIITYAGKLKGQLDPEPFFAAISELKREGRMAEEFLRLNIWGEVESWVHDLIDRYGLQKTVFIQPRISREEIVTEMQRSSLLLNLSWNDPQEKGVHPGKLFDYLGARRPILSIGRYRGVVAQLLEETQAGEQLWDTETLKRHLLERISEFRKHDQVPYRGNPAAVERYGYIAITREFARLMDEAVSED